MSMRAIVRTTSLEPFGGMQILGFGVARDWVADGRLENAQVARLVEDGGARGVGAVQVGGAVGAVVAEHEMAGLVADAVKPVHVRCACLEQVVAGVLGTMASCSDSS